MTAAATPAEYVLKTGTHAGKTVQQVYDDHGDRALTGLIGSLVKKDPVGSEAVKAFRKQKNAEAAAEAAGQGSPQAKAAADRRRTAEKAAKRHLAAVEDAELADDVVEGDEPGEAPAPAPDAAFEGGADDDGPGPVMEVLPRRALVWPDGTTRCGPGTRVYARDPLLSFAPTPTSAVYDQRFKLARAKDQSAPADPIRSRRWANEYGSRGFVHYVQEVSPGQLIPIRDTSGGVGADTAPAPRPPRADAHRPEREPVRDEVDGDLEVPGRVVE